MSSLRLVTGHDPAALLRAAAAPFLVRQPATADDPFPTPPVLLALRQGGLRDDVIALAAAAGVPGWFDPPLCIFHELPERLGLGGPPPLGDIERHVLVLRAIAESSGDGGVFGRLARPDDFADAVDALFGELASEGVEPPAFAAALEGRAGRDDFERRRDGELARAYAFYAAELARLDRSDGRDTLLRCARAVTSGAIDLSAALGGRRAVRLFGLADLRRGWRPLLHALAASPALDEVAVYTTAALDLAKLGFVAESLEEPETPAARLFLSSGGVAFEGPVEDRRSGARNEAAAAAGTHVAAPDPEREVAEVAQRVRRLIDGGAAPHRIAVVARKARPYVDLAAATLERFGVPATARQRIALGEIPAVRAVRTLFAAAAAGWTRAALVEVARQPYLDCGLDARVLDHIGYRHAVNGLAAWESALRRLEVQAKERDARRERGEDADDRRGHSLPATAAIVASREAFGAFAARARRLDRARPLGDWLEWLGELLAQDPWGIVRRLEVFPGERVDVVRRDLAGWKGLTDVVTEWRDAVRELGGSDEPLDVAAFDGRLAAALDCDVALWTPVQRGVQVLEALAASHRAFDHVFLVGMQAGAFPAAAGRSPILDEADRDALRTAGIPLDGRAEWEQRERELFRVLVAGAGATLTVSHARLDPAGRETIASAFVEELGAAMRVEPYAMPTSDVVIQGDWLAPDPSTAVWASHAAAAERARATGDASPHNGEVRDTALLAWLAGEFGDDRLWSPTQLEELAKCPWAFMSRRLLRLERLEDPDPDMDPATRGTVLHAALHQFYDRAAERAGSPVFLRASDAAWMPEVLDAALDAALAERGDAWLGHPSLRATRRMELRRTLEGFLAWEVELHETMLDPKTRKINAPKMVRTGVVRHELTFDDAEYVDAGSGVRIRYRGSIDRVEESVDERVPGRRFVTAVDYKTSRSATPGGGDKAAWDDGVVLQVPLYAHHLRAMHADAAVARVEYVTLRKPEHVHQLQLYTIAKRGTEPEPVEGAAERWQEALDAAVAHVRRAREGSFPAAPPPSCNCPPWCHGADICRVSAVHTDRHSGW